MKHINKKLSIRGGGGAPKPKPAILNPPKLGGFKPSASYSVAEIVDLISDGPIEGLVDQNGILLSDKIFKGVYLDNTPIQNTENNSINFTYASLNIYAKIQPIAQHWMYDEYTFKDLFDTVNDSQAVFYYDFTDTKYRSAFPTFEGFWLRSAAGNSSLPNFWTLSSSTIEFHHNNPFEKSSTILNTFRKLLQDTANSTTANSKSKSIAAANLKKLLEIQSFAATCNYVSGKRVPGISNTCFIIIDLGDLNISSNSTISSQEDLDFFINGFSDRFDYVTTLVQPSIIDNKYFQGISKGIVIIAAPLLGIRDTQHSEATEISYLPKGLISSCYNSQLSLQVIKKANNVSIYNDGLFNYSNVSCQFKKGEETQTSLDYFDKVVNDYMYESKLYGPYVKTGPVQRIIIEDNDKQFKDGITNLKTSVTMDAILNGAEGSNDLRPWGSAKNDFTSWNDVNETKDYDSLSVTHVIENPFVEQISVSILINELSDVQQRKVENVAGIGQTGGAAVLDAGAKIPTVVILRIETGKITNGTKTSVQSYNYAIAGLIEGSCVLDFGADYDEAQSILNDTIKSIDRGSLFDANLTRPFTLPELLQYEDPSITKRYVKVLKLSCETNSVLIKKDITLLKVSEIINEKLSYPFSAIAGMKLDARAFSSIPERSYDCKLKKVKIPTNYRFKNAQEVDVRYIKNANTYISPIQIYRGDWDGAFTEGWTDNPAWILYDLLTSKRYGLGMYIEESQVNKWELYKIARFCDAVDDLGYYQGVSDGVGGLEPRFSCNILFKEQTKIFDAINVIASLFRGVVFFGGSEIHFLDDRPRTPIALFNNANVKEGFFNYSNVRRDMQYNTMEVVYLDRFDNYKTKVEYVQDEQDIRKRGVFKNTVNTMGVTSRAMARRIGQHMIYQTIKENQNIEFVAGLEALLCRPGDLIIVEDDLKTRASNYGKVLEINNTQKTIRVDNAFDENQYTGFVTIYAPTGYSTSAELSGISSIRRNRVDQFTITGTFINTNNNILTGTYKFSGYTSGYSNSPIYPQQVPLYTGRHQNGHSIICYYNTGATGFVFATGRAFQDNDTFDKVITNTGVFYGVDFAPSVVSNPSNWTGFLYQQSQANRRVTPGTAISGNINWNSNLYPLTRGVLDTEIDTYDISQITKIAFSGYLNLDYGSILYLNQNDANARFLPAVKPGSIYRIDRKSASDQIYKVISIRENNQNEYAVAASRYDTGKFNEIEKAVTQDFLSNTYYTGPITVNNAQVRQVAMPTITQFTVTGQTASNFQLTGRWTSGANVTGFAVSISNSLAGYSESRSINTSGVLFTNLTDIGNWELSVTALASSPNINSMTATTGTFVAYAGNLTSTNRPVINSFTLQ